MLKTGESKHGKPPTTWSPSSSPNSGYSQPLLCLLVCQLGQQGQESLGAQELQGHPVLQSHHDHPAGARNQIQQRTFQKRQAESLCFPEWRVRPSTVPPVPSPEQTPVTHLDSSRTISAGGSVSTRAALDRGHEDSLRAAPCLLSHSGLKPWPVHFCPTETSGLTCPLSFHPPSSLHTQSWSLCASSPQNHPSTPSSRAHLSSRFTCRPCQARRPHGTRRTSVSRCTGCTLLARLTLKGCRQGP